MEKAKARGKEYHPDISNKNLLLPLSKEYLAHVLSAFTSAYALGKSEKFIRSILLEPLTEATIKEYKYRKNHKADLLIIISAFILLNLDKRDFGKFTDKLKENGFSDRHPYPLPSDRMGSVRTNRFTGIEIPHNPTARWNGYY